MKILCNDVYKVCCCCCTYIINMYIMSICAYNGWWWWCECLFYFQSSHYLYALKISLALHHCLSFLSLSAWPLVFVLKLLWTASHNRFGKPFPRKRQIVLSNWVLFITIEVHIKNYSTMYILFLNLNFVTNSITN